MQSCIHIWKIQGVKIKVENVEVGFTKGSFDALKHNWKSYYIGSMGGNGRKIGETMGNVTKKVGFQGRFVPYFPLKLPNRHNNYDFPHINDSISFKPLHCTG